MNRESNKTRKTIREPRGMRFRNISIIGDGAMATVMAILLCEKNMSVRMWGYDRRQLKQIESAGENVKFLTGYRLPKNLAFEPDDERIMADADLIVSAVPCQFVRQVFERLKAYVPDGVPIVSTAKGIENDTLLRPTQILTSVLFGNQAIRDELGKFDSELRGRPEIVAVTKADLPAAAEVQQRMCDELGHYVLLISAVTGTALDELVGEIAKKLQKDEEDSW